MPTHNPENERIKRAYFLYLREARRLGEHSVDAAAAALSRFEKYNKYRGFRLFHIQQAVGFKHKLAEQVSSRTGEPLSASTLHSNLNALKAFFHWLAGQPGYRSRLTHADADYFALSEKETRVAKATRERPIPSIEQIVHVLRAMPTETEIQRRNRAVIAFTLLTGARDGAIASLMLKHVDLAQERVIQDPREVRTKFAKNIVTWFFPVGEEVRTIVVEWIGFLTEVAHFGPTDPLFPATRVIVGDNMSFQANGLTRSHWSNATPIRKIFKEAFEAAGFPYANPHSLRKTLAQLGERLCRTPEQFKAWSQNLGHEHVLTTLSSYGEVSTMRQGELIRALGRPTHQKALGDARKLDDLARLIEEARRELE